MREIVLDTETTGFEPEEGHRLVEIGCVEVINKVPTGKIYHQYINPERDMPTEAFNVHGLSEEFLSDFPLFTEVVKDFNEFVGEDKLVIHNAEFDMKFLNAELTLAGFKPLLMERAIDTLLIARERYPGSPANLDALCRRFGIDNSDRTYHGALLDAELLSEVYLELSGGRQRGLDLGADGTGGLINTAIAPSEIKRQDRPKRTFSPSEEELKAHKELLKKLDSPLWLKDSA